MYYFILSLFLVISSGLGTLSYLVARSSPDVNKIHNCFFTQMNKVHLCPNSKDYVSLEEISPYLIQAVLISEDAGFYSHKGFDWFEVKESFRENLRKKSFARGGSTITQQLVKNLYLSGEKSLVRKLIEAYVTVQVEQKLTKPEILEKYLNVIEFAPKIYGIKVASYYFFQKPPADLSLLESAFIAHVLPNPKLYSKNFLSGKLSEFNKERMIDIINKLYFYKKISEEEQVESLTDLDQAVFPSSQQPNWL